MNGPLTTERRVVISQTSSEITLFLLCLLFIFYFWLGVVRGVTSSNPIYLFYYILRMYIHTFIISLELIARVISCYPACLTVSLYGCQRLMLCLCECPSEGHDVCLSDGHVYVCLSEGLPLCWSVSELGFCVPVRGLFLCVSQRVLPICVCQRAVSATVPT